MHTNQELDKISSDARSGDISNDLKQRANDIRKFYVWVSVHHKLVYIKNQRDATWQYVY